MNKKWCLLLALLVSGVSWAKVDVSEARARFTVAGMSAGGVFLTLHNHGAADRLIGAQSPMAQRVEIHTHAMQDGKMVMQPLPNGLALPKNGEVVLQPGGEHLMLIGLKEPLRAGMRFPLTLKFAHQGEQTVMVSVQSPADEAAQSESAHHSH